jgi:hypothetical protein
MEDSIRKAPNGEKLLKEYQFEKQICREHGGEQQYKCQEKIDEKYNRLIPPIKDMVYPWRNYDWNYSTFVDNTYNTDAVGMSSAGGEWINGWKATLIENPRGMMRIAKGYISDPNPDPRSAAGALFSPSDGKKYTDTSDCIKIEGGDGVVIKEGPYAGKNGLLLAISSTPNASELDGLIFVEGEELYLKLTFPTQFGPRPDNGFEFGQYIACLVLSNIKIGYQAQKPPYNDKFFASQELSGENSSSYFIKTGFTDRYDLSEEECLSNHFTWIPKAVPGSEGKEDDLSIGENTGKCFQNTYGYVNNRPGFNFHMDILGKLFAGVKKAEAAISKGIGSIFGGVGASIGDGIGKIENTITGGIEDLVMMAADGGIKEFKGAIPAMLDDGIAMLPNFSAMTGLGMDTTYWKHQPHDLISSSDLKGPLKEGEKLVKSGEDAVKNVFHHLEGFSNQHQKKSKWAVSFLLVAIILLVLLVRLL